MTNEDCGDWFEDFCVLPWGAYWAEAAIRSCLDRLPEVIREWTRDNVIFLPAPQDVNAVAYSIRIGAGCIGTKYVPCESDQDTEERFAIRIVYLDHGLHNEPEDIRPAIVAHEVAHCYLGHPERPVGGTEWEANERDADALASQWGFAEEIARHVAAGAVRTVKPPIG